MARQRYGLGHFNSPVIITYKLDKHGRKRAYRSHIGSFRKFPMSLDLAEMIEAAGEALDVQWERPALEVLS